MRITYQVGADSRHDQGKGASRRLRRAGKVPAVIYGGQGGPRSITLDHQQLLTLIDKEKFYSSIISINVDSQSQPAIIRDVQMHPARNAVVHVDLQRVVESEKLKIHLPIHFKGEAIAPGVKTQGGIVSHLMQDVEVELSAGRSAGIPRTRPVGDESQRDPLAGRHQTADGSHDPGAGTSQPRGGIGAQPARGGARARGRGCADPEVAAAGAAATPAAAAPAAGAEGAKKDEAKKEAAPAKKEGGKK